MLKSGLLAKIAFTLLVVSAMVWLAKVGLADFLRLAPCVYIDALNKKTVALDPVELDKARERLKLAQSWDSGNPIMPEYLAQTDYMLAQLLAFSPSMQADFLQKAIVNMDSAVALRPYSAYLWAARMSAGNWLLEVKVKLNADASSRQAELSVVKAALRHADVLDPWNPLVLEQIVKVGMSRYAELSGEDRKTVDSAVMRAKQLNLKI